MWLIFIKRSCLPCILNFLLYEVQAFPSGTRHWHKLPFFVRSKKKKVCEEIDSLLFPQRYSRCCSRLGIPNHPLTYYSSHSSVTLRPNNIIYIQEKLSNMREFTHMHNKHSIYVVLSVNGYLIVPLMETF